MKKMLLTMLAILLLASSCYNHSKPIREYDFNGHHYLVFYTNGGEWIPIHDPDCPNHQKDTIRIYKVIKAD